jgi:hypothetical protein
MKAISLGNYTYSAPWASKGLSAVLYSIQSKKMAIKSKNNGSKNIDGIKQRPIPL